MINIIKKVEVYSPRYLGKKDIVFTGNQIEGIYDNADIKSDALDIVEIDGNNKIAFPGFIDGHVHILGGGGEGGFNTRTPEIKLSDLTTSGITTVVGCIGTDGVCRDSKALLAKAKSLEEEGITTYCYTGSYDVQVKAVTEDIKSDIMLIDKFIGVGEIALSDNRSSQSTFEEFISICAKARVAGLLSGKAGVVNVHLGSGKRGLDFIFKVIEESEIPPTQLIPTHINRNNLLFQRGIKYVKKGGYIDLTTSTYEGFLEEGELLASEGLKLFLDEGLNIEHITFTSDGNGSIPKFDRDKKLIGLGICETSSLYREVKKAITNYNIPIETAIKVITSNVASILKLPTKGYIGAGFDADMVLVDSKTYEIKDVYAKGRLLVKDGTAVVKGTFE